MNREEILDKVKEVLNTTMSVEGVKEEDRLREDVGVDSIDKIHFFMDLEEEFDIEIPEQDYEQIFTIKETVDYLTTKV